MSNKPFSRTGGDVPPKRDLLYVEWVAILLAIAIVCALAFALAAIFP